MKFDHAKYPHLFVGDISGIAIGDSDPLKQYVTQGHVGPIEFAPPSHQIQQQFSSKSFHYR